MKARRFRRRLVMVFLALYAIVVAIITLSPRMPGAATVGRLVNRLLRALHSRGIALWADYLTVEFIGNILMFVPLGVLTALLVDRRSWWTLLFAGTLFSAVLEIGQLLFLPDRVPEWRDILSNTIGFLIGASLAIAVRLIVQYRDGLVLADAEAAREARQS